MTLADVLSAHPRFWGAANHWLLSLMAVVSYLQQPLGRKSHSLLQKLISSPKLLLARDSSFVLDRILLTEDEKRSPTPSVPMWDVNPLWLHILPLFFSCLDVPRSSFLWEGRASSQRTKRRTENGLSRLLDGDPALSFIRVPLAFWPDHPEPHSETVCIRKTGVLATTLAVLKIKEKCAQAKYPSSEILGSRSSSCRICVKGEQGEIFGLFAWI